MANPNSFGSFAEGLTSGIDSAQRMRRSYEVNQGLQEARADRKQAKDFRNEVSGVPVGELDTPPELQGPQPEGAIGPLTKVSGADRLAAWEARAHGMPDKESREAALAQVQHARFSTAALSISQAANAKDPRAEVAALNKAAGIIGMGEQYFQLQEDGKITSPDGEVNENTYNFLRYYAKNPELAMRWMQETNMAERTADREDRKVALSAEEVMQGWTSAAQRWKVLGLDERKFINDKDEFDRVMRLKMKELDVDSKLAGAQSRYYIAKAAEAEATAELAGFKPVWTKNADIINAMDKLDKQYVDATDAVFTDEYAEQYGATGEGLRNTAATMGKEALVEHGAGSMAEVKQGSAYALGFMLNDPESAVTDVVIEDGRAFIVVEGQDYPVSLDTATTVAGIKKARMDQSEEAAKGIFGSGIPTAPAKKPLLEVDAAKPWRMVQEWRTKNQQKIEDFYRSPRRPMTALPE